jgi:hypothetical protein
MRGRAQPAPSRTRTDGSPAAPTRPAPRRTPRPRRLTTSGSLVAPGMIVRCALNLSSFSTLCARHTPTTPGSRSTACAPCTGRAFLRPQRCTLSSGSVPGRGSGAGRDRGGRRRAPRSRDSRTPPGERRRSARPPDRGSVSVPCPSSPCHSPMLAGSHSHGLRVTARPKRADLGVDASAPREKLDSSTIVRLRARQRGQYLAASHGTLGARDRPQRGQLSNTRRALSNVHPRDTTPPPASPLDQCAAMGAGLYSTPIVRPKLPMPATPGARPAVSNPGPRAGGRRSRAQPHLRPGPGRGNVDGGRHHPLSLHDPPFLMPHVCTNGSSTEAVPPSRVSRFAPLAPGGRGWDAFAQRWSVTRRHGRIWPALSCPACASAQPSIDRAPDEVWEPSPARSAVAIAPRRMRGGHGNARRG